MEILELLADLQKKAKKDILDDGKRAKALTALDRAEAAWKREGEPNFSHPAYLTLVEKARVLKGKGPLEYEAVLSLSRYCVAAWYDATGQLGPYKWFVRCFFAAAIAFFALAPQYLPAILSLVFVIPIYLGLRGIKRRTRDGRNLGMSIFPMTAIAAITAIRGYVMAMSDWNGYITRMSESFKVSVGMATGMSIAFMIVAVVGLVAAIAGTWLGFKNRELFA